MRQLGFLVNGFIPRISWYYNHTMPLTRRTVKVILLLLYTALFIVSEWFFLKQGKQYSLESIPFMYTLVVIATLLATALTFIEHRKLWFWSFLTHSQFLLCFNPVVLHLIDSLHKMREQLSLESVGAGFMIGFDGYLLAYVMLPLNAICVVAYYVWAKINAPEEAKQACGTISLSVEG